MFYLKDEREVRLFEITGIEGTEVERALKTILEEYKNIVSQEIYNIRNYQIIEYAIRFLDKTLIVEK